MRTRFYEVVGPLDYDPEKPFRLTYTEAGRDWFVREAHGRPLGFATVQEAQAHRATLVPHHAEKIPA